MGNVEDAGAKLQVIFKSYQKIELPTKLHFFGLRREKISLEYVKYAFFFKINGGFPHFKSN